MLKHRFLGNSGLLVSEITFGNGITHGSQVEEEQAIRTVHRALDLGITSFDTADSYADRAAEKILGAALKDLDHEDYEVFSKVYWPVGKQGPNNSGLSRKHIFDSAHRP